MISGVRGYAFTAGVVQDDISYGLTDIYRLTLTRGVPAPAPLALFLPGLLLLLFRGRIAPIRGQ